MRCAVYNCRHNNDFKQKGYRFYSFPIKNPKILKEWIHFCGRVDNFSVKTARICSEHFRKDDFERNIQFEMGSCKKNGYKLKPGTCPSVHPNTKPTSECIKIEKEEEYLDRTNIVAELLRQTIEPAKDQAQTDAQTDEIEIDLCAIKQIPQITIIENTQCRTCGTFQSYIDAKEMRLLFPAKPNYSMKFVLQQLKLWNIAVDNSDGLACHICNACYNQFYLMQNFRKSCQQTDQQIRKSLAAMKAAAVIVKQPEMQILLSQIKPTQDNMELQVKEAHLDEYNSTINETTKVDCIAKKANLIDKGKFKTSEVEANPLLCLLCISLDSNDLLYPTKEALKQHQQQEHLDRGNTTKCLICNRYFSDLKAAKLHFKNQHCHGENCHICGKFLRARSIRVHIQSHLKSNYTCEICNLVMRNCTKFRFDYHMRWHDDKKQYTCPHEGCTKIFLQKSHLNAHITTHTHKRQIICSKCGKDFVTIVQLKTHNITNHGAKSDIKCKFCSQVFRSYGQRSKHMSKLHSTAYTIKCDTCKKCFYNEYNLRYHIRVAHNTEAANNKIKTTKSKTINYQRGFYRCSHCVQTFRCESTLATHMQLHTPHESRPYACPACPSFYKLMNNLRVHQKLSHSAEKPYQCGICRKKFVLRFSLRTHMQSHSADKFKCDQCECKFSFKQSLVVHKRIKHDNKPTINCDYCV